MTELSATAPHIHDATSYDDLADWGPQPDALSGASHSNGRLLFKGPGNSPECGIWVCTPGRWRIAVPRDEFCYFMQGRAQYRHDNGEVVDVSAGTAVVFRAGWTGEAEIFETTRNSYMLT
ncbi:cupin domain-containing protein [Roseobacter ponti]|uniref:cupin domain-containing protein n=1 Tax=Roseobacter ponti TaxID=1891787 RepID=UPI00197DB56F|nr:cupin domain-containing protein [Roseobacter ponti]